jgi:ABC-type dipeptide/oligopeptide/nickel transport system ATPase component
MNFRDKITNWTDKTKNGKNMFPLDKNFKLHLIKPCSMIAIIGPTGSGKSTAVIEFLNRKNKSFYKIIIFSGATTDEPLLNTLKEACPDVELISDVEHLPELKDFDDDEKSKEKLIVFDDIINLPKKKLETIQKWFNSARKFGFTCIVLAQKYSGNGGLPIQIRGNAQYYFIFKLRDTGSITQIIRNHNIDGKDKDLIMKAYHLSTKGKGNFFLMDLQEDSPYPYRHNFTDIIEI